MLPLLDGNVRLRVTPGDSNAGEGSGDSLTGDESSPSSLLVLSSISSNINKPKLNHQHGLIATESSESCAPCVRRRVIVLAGLLTSFHPPDIDDSPPSSELGCTNISSADPFMGSGVAATCLGGGGISSMNQSCWAIRNSRTF